MEPGHAAAAASGLHTLVVFLDDLSDELQRIVSSAAREHGVDCLTGERWLAMAGAASRLAALTRSRDTQLPKEIGERVGSAIAPYLDPPFEWETTKGVQCLDPPIIVGIVNVTPDSFSDGGAYLDPDAALEHAEHLVKDGATMLDIGAESTRPGRPSPVPEVEEWRRLEPVLTGLEKRIPTIPVSVDTTKSEIARRAIEVGAVAINDVSGLRDDPAIADCCAEAGAGLVLMHSRGSVSELATYDHAVYADVSREVVAELATARDTAVQRGVRREQIVVDPGFGFSKTPEQTFTTFRHLASLQALGQPIMVGPSRKRFLGQVTGREAADRDVATAAACAMAYALGARLFRVHAVSPTRDALAVATAIEAP